MNHPSFPSPPDTHASVTTVAGPRRRQHRLLTTVVAGVVAVAVFAALFGWRALRAAGPAPGQRPPVAVAAMVLKPIDMPATLEAVGSLSAVREVTLSPETAGRVVDIDFEAGAAVAAGARLVQLYDGPEQADRASARARAKLAELQLSRTKELAETGAESRGLLDQRTAERDQALAEVRQLDARIEQKQIRAPFAGTIGIRRIDPGQYLNPGDEIATLTDSSQLFVDFHVPQQHLSQLRPGSTVKLTTDTWPDRQFTATVNAVESRVDADTRNVAVQALLPNPDGALRPGMYVNAVLELPAEHDALVVPPTAINSSAMGDSVLVVRGPEAAKQGQAEYVRVTLGRRVGDQVVVTQGLRAGDVVVTEGQLRVPPGAPVQVTQLQPVKG